MRNLRILRKFVSGSPLPLPGSSSFCIGENGYLFDVIGLEESVNGGDNCKYFLSNLVRVSEFAHIEEIVKSNVLQDVFHMQFVNNTGCLYLGTKRGQFLQFHLQVGDVEELFQSETGLAMFAVSPDSRFVSIITRSGVLLLMSLPNLDVIFEEELFDWKGLKENGLPCSVQICWRHDSQYFVVNIPDAKTGRRLKVYDGQGTLFSSSEDSTYLLSDIVTWKPSGGLIAAIEKPPIGKDGLLISYFELNGLKRSSFNPYEGKTEDMNNLIVSISWNSSSDLLAVKKLRAVELWHRSNYVWMCKTIIQRQITDLEFDPIKFFGWDREHPYKLYIVFESGLYSFYDLILAYSSGHSGGSALTASINGANLSCTPFRDNSAPPPYGFFQISLESAVKEIVINHFWDGFLCVLFTGRIVVVKHTGGELLILRVLTIANDSKPHLLSSYNWIWPNALKLCCISENRILVFQLPEDMTTSDSSSVITQINSIQMNCSSMSVITEDNSKESSYVLVRKHGGALLLLNLNSLEDQSHVLFKVPLDCFHNMKYLFQSDESPSNPFNQAHFEDRLIVIGHDHQTRKLEIFIHNKASAKLATDCTSIATFEDYLLFTTFQGSLEIIHISQLEKAVTASTNGDRTQVEQYSRKVEKGSVILTCCLNRMLEPTLVLQVLPRGNIETIHPRPLVIASIKKLLRDKAKRSFSVIMGAMRRHRIDANELVDELRLVEKEGTFNLSLKDALKFMVTEVKDSSLLVLFVTEIKTENMDCVYLLKTVLEEFTKSPDGKSGISPYLATMAKLGLYEEILNSQLILGEEDRQIVKSRVKFVSFYAENGDTLYEAALGTYDLNLTAVVTDCLNRDPKEYLPIFNNLRALPFVKRCFVIDNSLKRWVKGLKSLLEDPSIEIEEIAKYVERHRLFPDSLHLVSTPSVSAARSQDELTSIRKCLQNSYGNYLEANEKQREASILYKRAGNMSKAIECSVKGGCWESTLVVDEEPESYEQMYQDVLSILRQKQEWGNAARLCEVYLGDYRLALEFWVNAKKWISAQALIRKDPTLKDMTCKLIKPKLIEHHLALNDSLKTLFSEFKHHITRLRAIKAKKEALKVAGETEGDNFSDTESISTTSSMKSTIASSIVTGRTYRSGKSKRKLERKLYSLKEGSRHEDIGITVHLWESITRLQQETKADVTNTTECLWRFELDEEALQLSSFFDDLVEEVDRIVKEVWPLLLIEENSLLESKYRVAPTAWTATWEKLSFLSTSSCV